MTVTGTEISCPLEGDFALLSTIMTCVIHALYPAKPKRFVSFKSAVTFQDPIFGYGLFARFRGQTCMLPCLGLCAFGIFYSFYFFILIANPSLRDLVLIEKTYS